jgi:hypothetical protein
VLQEATRWSGPSDETGKTEAQCHSRVARHDKDPFLLKAECRAKALLPFTGGGDVSSEKIFERNVKKAQIIKQSTIDKAIVLQLYATVF